MKPFAKRCGKFPASRPLQAAYLMGPLLLWAAIAAADPDLQPKRVLLLDSFGRDFAPWNTVSPAFKAELVRQSIVPVEFHEIAVEVSRSNAPQAEVAFEKYLRALYTQHHPDLAVLFGGAAARFWWEHRDDLFPSTPAVFGAIDQQLLRTIKLTTNDTAVVTQFDLAGGIEIILQLLPGTTNIAVVMGNSPLEQFWVAECRRAWQPFTNRVRFTWFNQLSFEEMCRRAANLPPHSVLAYGMLVVDARGVPHEQMSALARLRAVANAPVFGVQEEQLGHGIIGGRLFFSGTSLGRTTARIAARVLHGESPGTIPVTLAGAGRPIFDWRELQRWHIDKSRLPPDSIVRFRRPSVWKEYRWYIVGAFGIFAIQTLTIIALLAQRRRRRLAEANLRENQLSMELATSAGELGLWGRNMPGAELHVNPRLRFLFGLPSEGPIRLEEVLARIHPNDRPRAEAALQHAVSQGGAFEFEGRLLLPDHTQRWIVTKGLATRDGHGRPLRTEGVVLDLTARHEAELAAQRHRDELRHVGRIHVLGQLSSALAHELNQPLGAILSNTEAAELLLRSESPSWEEVRAILNDIRKDDQRASDVIRRMRSLLKRREMELSPLPAADLVEDCVALVRPDAIERNVRIESVLMPGAPRVRGDRVHLEQVLLNLLLNGMDAMRDYPVERRRLTVRAEPGGDHTIEFSVADRGTGIPPDQLDRIFESFYTTKPNGLGLGLSISRAIIEAHHGRIWAENNPEGGATFRFALPAVEART